MRSSAERFTVAAVEDGKQAALSIHNALIMHKLVGREIMANPDDALGKNPQSLWFARRRRLTEVNVTRAFKAGWGGGLEDAG